MTARRGPRDYLDFELEIREGGPHEYPLAVRSPAGEAQAEMRFPFDDHELENKLLAIENALLRSGGSRRGPSPEEQAVQDFGERLFKAVLTGDIRTRYEVSLREAKQQNKGLRLKLLIQPPNLASLPWEFLYDPDRDEYLCFSRDTPIVRYSDLRQPVGRLTVEPPLRILGMVASPRDLDPHVVEHEKSLMEEAIEDLQARGLVELTWLAGQTWRDLQRSMRGGPWHIFHFIGHGDFDSSSGEGRVAFPNETTGYQETLAARNLARWLDGQPALRLAYLNSSQGAKGSEGDPFSGIAANLVRRGVPAVVAMQYEMTDQAAIEFSRAFYHALANGLPVDAAVSAARIAVSINNTLEWGTPVLYMRSPDGRLFDIKKENGEEQEPLRRYREDVQVLGNTADNELGLTPSTAADIEPPTVSSGPSTAEVPEHPAPEQPDVLSPETIFISYNRKDWDEFVEPLVNALRQRGLKVWIDQLGIKGGTDWGDVIDKALKTCQRMVVCVSPNSMESDQVKKEYRYFLKRHKTIIPLLCREADNTPYDLDNIQYIPYENQVRLIEELTIS